MPRAKSGSTRYRMPPEVRPTESVGANPSQAQTLVADLIDRLSERFESGAKEAAGISTGFLELDRLTTGMHEGDLIVVGGRPSIGKSAFALNVAEHVATRCQLPVLIFSLEMDCRQLMERLVSAVGRVNLQCLRTADLDDAEWNRVSDATERLAAAPLVIDDSPSLSIDELSSLARERASEIGRLGLVVVDYLQLIAARGPGAETRAGQIGEISRGLKLLARELNCPVMALSQLNRALELRADKRPVMSDLRDSGTIEEDADVVAFVYRDDYYTHSNSKRPGIAEIIVGKQRNGPTGTVQLCFLPRHNRFDNLVTGDY